MTQVKLSNPMHYLLVQIDAAGAAGFGLTPSKRKRLPTVQALHRRGLVEFRGTRATPRVMSWHSTESGRAWLAAEEVRRRAR